MQYVLIATAILEHTNAVEKISGVNVIREELSDR